MTKTKEDLLVTNPSPSNMVYTHMCHRRNDCCYIPTWQYHCGCWSCWQRQNNSNNKEEIVNVPVATATISVFASCSSQNRRRRIVGSRRNPLSDVPIRRPSRRLSNDSSISSISTTSSNRSSSNNKMVPFPRDFDAVVTSTIPALVSFKSYCNPNHKMIAVSDTNDFDWQRRHTTNLRDPDKISTPPRYPMRTTDDCEDDDERP
jgi:hypothetical protein